MYKDAPMQFNYYSMVEARALVTNYFQPTWARRLWRHYLPSLTGGAGSLLLSLVLYPFFGRRMDTRSPDREKSLSFIFFLTPSLIYHFFSFYYKSVSSGAIKQLPPIH